MDVRLKRKYLKKARNVLKRKEQAGIFCSTGTSSSLSGTPTDSRLDVSQETSMHIEANRELKRLLLASVGSELEQQLESLVTEKSHLQLSLNRSIDQLNIVVEEADHLSIECDVWRSKFLASRVMIDELASDKSSLSVTQADFVQSLNALLTERDELGRHVAMCNHMLKQCLMHLNKADGLFLRGHVGNIVDVATVNSKATRQLLESLTTKLDQRETDLPEEHFDMSYGEELAHKMLSLQQQQKDVSHVPKHSLPHLSVGEKHLLQRTREPRLPFRNPVEELWPPAPDSLSLHYCRKCVGKVLVI